MDKVPAHVRDIMRTLEENGFAACLVGGCVRDMLIGRKCNDWDVATSATCDEVVRLFPKTAETGRRFGTVTVITGQGNVEVTTFRSDGVYSDGRRPDNVEFVGDLLEDLKRRDFTVNAIAMRPDGAIVDPFDGRGDIGRRLIKCVGRAEDRFSEDALRMFRALRLSAQLGFEVEEGTLLAARRCAHLCARLSAERVRDETEKMLMSDRPGVLERAIELGLFAGRLGPAAKDVERVGRIGGLPREPMLRWAAFAGVLLGAGAIGSAGDFLRAMRLDSRTARCAGQGASIAALRGVGGRLDAKRLVAEVGRQTARCAAAAEEVLKESGALETVEEVILSGECCSLRELAVSGDDLAALGLERGPAVGAMLKSLLGHVLEHPEDNRRDVLMRLAAEMTSQSGAGTKAKKTNRQPK